MVAEYKFLVRTEVPLMPWLLKEDAFVLVVDSDELSAAALILSALLVERELSINVDIGIYSKLRVKRVVVESLKTFLIYITA